MGWNLQFINRDQLKKQIYETIKAYSNNMTPVGLNEFNENIIDPIKLIFDCKVCNKKIATIISEEIARQRDKSNSNAIGYFHQNLFKSIKNCEVPNQGFDIIYHKKNGDNIYAELKNKHNTMNSSSSKETYRRMQKKLQDSNNKNDLCYFVEVIAKRSQNIEWRISIDNIQTTNERIRRVSIDQFYKEVTGDRYAFKKICDILPELIDEILKEHPKLFSNNDTIYSELTKLDKNIIKALYLLAFKTYEGFGE